MKRLFLIALLAATPLQAQNLEKAAFAGGCFWCTEEAFEKLGLAMDSGGGRGLGALSMGEVFSGTGFLGKSLSAAMQSSAIFPSGSV